HAPPPHPSQIERNRAHFVPRTMEALARPDTRIRVLIADDHRLFAEALQAILDADDRIDVVGHAGDGREAVQLAAQLQPDIVLMDSGRDAGMGGMGFTPASQCGTHIVERNLTRLTIVIAILFFANSIALFHYLK